MFQSILVPLAGSVFREQPWPAAEALARRAHAGLHPVHVHVPIVTIYVGRLPVDNDHPPAEADMRRRKRC